MSPEAVDRVVERLKTGDAVHVRVPETGRYFSIRSGKDEAWQHRWYQGFNSSDGPKKTKKRILTDDGIFGWLSGLELAATEVSGAALSILASVFAAGHVDARAGELDVNGMAFARIGSLGSEDLSAYNPRGDIALSDADRALLLGVAGFIVSEDLSGATHGMAYATKTALDYDWKTIQAQVES